MTFIPLPLEDTGLPTHCQASCAVAKPRRGAGAGFVLRFAGHAGRRVPKPGTSKWEGYKTLSVCLFVFLLRISPAAWSQSDDPDWKESPVPPAPAFEVSKLISLDMGPYTALRYGIDPNTIRITNSDSVVRYVVVASSASGARNALYEGIRCATGEFKTYARYVQNSWVALNDPQWRSMFDSMPSKHALRFARAAACDSAATTSSVDAIVKRLQSPFFQGPQ